jgi:hypothetical protein
MSKYQQVDRRILCELIHRNRAQASAFVTRSVSAARARAPIGERARPVRVQRPEGFDRHTIPHYRTNHPVSAVFFLSQPIAMVNPGIPSGDVAAPGTDVIFDADVLAKNFIAPAVMVAGDEEDRQPCIAQISERCQSAKAVAGYNGLPLEPEIEEVTVDYERTRMTCKSSQESNEPPLDVERRNTEMRVGDYIAG